MAGLLALAVVSAIAVAARPRLQPEVGWLIFVDDLYIQFTISGYLRQLVKVIATDLVREGEAFTIAVTLGTTSNSDGVDRTTDRDRMSLFARLAVPVVSIDPQQFVPRKQPIARVDPDVTALTKATPRVCVHFPGALAVSRCSNRVTSPKSSAERGA